MAGFCRPTSLRLPQVVKHHRRRVQLSGQSRDAGRWPCRRPSAYAVPSPVSAPHTSNESAERQVNLRGFRGRKRQLAIEDAYWQLTMDGGWHGRGLPPGGITRKTGSRWRAERDGCHRWGWLKVSAASGTCRWLSGSGLRTPHGVELPVYAKRGLEFTASRRAPRRFSAGPSARVRLGAPREHPSREATAR
jgi:hypothetical protein